MIFAVLFTILLLRNPFSLRTQIPNLEPYPDSMYYITPALSFLKGSTFGMVREGRSFSPSVPPLYSLSLMPAFVIRPDARMFYITNVILSLISLGLFAQLLSQLKFSKWVRMLGLFLFVTNPLLLWYPERAMAENLLLPLFLGGCLLLLSKPSARRLVASLGIALSFVLTKYAAVPLTVVFGGLSVLHANTTWKKANRFLLLLGVLASAVGLALFVRHQSAEFFSFSYFRSGISAYGGWLLGKPMWVLWQQFTPLQGKLAIVGMIGLFAGLLRSKRRVVSFGALAMLFSTVLFMATFYVADGRYLYIAIPILIVGCLLFAELFGKFSKVIAILLMGIVLVFSAKNLKTTVMMNLRYAETPWYYIAVQQLDTYLAALPKEANPPVVVSALPPYYMDYFMKTNAVILPLDANQEFRGHKEQAWGSYDFSNLPVVYRELLRSGRRVFVEQYGLGNEAYLHKDFDALKTSFVMEEKQSGCYDLCNIYELHERVQ